VHASSHCSPPPHTALPAQVHSRTVEKTLPVIHKRRLHILSLSLSLYTHTHHSAESLYLFISHSPKAQFSEFLAGEKVRSGGAARARSPPLTLSLPNSLSNSYHSPSLSHSHHSPSLSPSHHSPSPSHTLSLTSLSITLSHSLTHLTLHHSPTLSHSRHFGERLASEVCVCVCVCVCVVLV
jgi:hypothetical protein